jgi:flagellar hook protein FlgE
MDNGRNRNKIFNELKKPNKNKTLKKKKNHKIQSMQFKKILSILILLLLIQNSFALTENIEINVSKDGTTQVMHSIELETETQTEIELLSNPINLIVSCENKCEYELNNETLTINELNEINSIQVNYSSNSLTNKEGETWNISVAYNSNTEEIKLIFSEETKITNFKPPASVYFDGINMIVLWQKRNLEEGTGNASTQYSYA